MKYSTIPTAKIKIEFTKNDIRKKITLIKFIINSLRDSDYDNMFDSEKYNTELNLIIDSFEHSILMMLNFNHTVKSLYSLELRLQKFICE